MIWLWHNTLVRSFDDSKKIYVILGATDKKSGTYVWLALINHMLGSKFCIVTGYRTGAWIDQAAEQGEVHGRWTPYSDLSAGKLKWLQRDVTKILLQIGPRIDEHPEAPSLNSLVSGEFKQMVDFMALSERVDMGFWVRPEVPCDRIAGLRQAFVSALSDPRVVKDARKRGAVIDPISGHRIDQMVARAYKSSAWNTV